MYTRHSCALGQPASRPLGSNESAEPHFAAATPGFSRCGFAPGAASGELRATLLTRIMQRFDGYDEADGAIA